MKINLSEKAKRNIREWVESIVIALILALIIRTFVVQAFKIPSGSMRETLIERDRILVNKFIYRFTDPQRGDIIVFRYPLEPKKDFVKRLIGLPGETVSIKDGDIYINGELAREPLKVREIYYYNKGVYAEDAKAVEIPADSYYVLGDNSASSRDSRYWGFVPKENLLGKAFLIYWPPNRIRLLK
jgi:signal peptidase I